MPEKITRPLYILVLLSLLAGGCAWENLPEEGVQKDFRLKITMRVQGTIDKNLFYFMVFNFSGDTSKKPKPEFEDDERGMYWDAYYMYGNPRLTGNDFYRAVAGTTQQGYNRLDLRPIASYEMVEFVPSSSPKPGTVPQNLNSIVLELDFGKITPPNKINLNMMVSSLPFDRIDNPDDQWDATIYDSFLFEGVTLNLSGSDTDFNEEEYKVEDDENIGENPPPNANIIFWRVQIL